MAEPAYSEIYRCKKDSGTFQPNSPYKTNLISALTKLPGSTHIIVGSTSPNAVVAATLCAGYLSPTDCVSCVNKTIPLLQQKCPNQKGAAAWRVKCMVRYGPPITNNYDLWFVAHEVSVAKVKDVAGLEKTLSARRDMLMRNVFSDPLNKYAYWTEVYGSAHENLHIVMQCTSDTLPDDCKKCLLHISRELKPCCNGAIAAAVLTPNCYLRHADADFRVV